MAAMIEVFQPFKNKSEPILETLEHIYASRTRDTLLYIYTLPVAFSYNFYFLLFRCFL